MHRIDTDGALTGGQFTDGNPAVGQQGTQVDSSWLNDVQENIAQAIEHAGIALVKGDGTQLTKALLAMIAGVIGSGGGAVPTTREVLGGGLIQGGSTLDQDVTLSLAKALPADLIAGVDDLKVPTSAQLAALFGTDRSANGSIELPGGLILKYGSLGQAVAEGQYSIVFPTPFPNACLRAPSIVGVNASASSNRDIWPQLVSKAKDKLIVFVQWTGLSSTTNSLDDIEYWAIGY